MHALAGHVIVGGVAVLVLIGGVLIGRMWRRQYRSALAYRMRLEQAAKSSASASAGAQASGNVVDIHFGSRRVGHGDGELILPASVRAGFDRGLARGSEALSGGDDAGVPVAVGEYRAPFAGRLLFGARGALPRGVDSGGGGAEGGEG